MGSWLQGNIMVEKNLQKTQDNQFVVRIAGDSRFKSLRKMQKAFTADGVRALATTYFIVVCRKLKEKICYSVVNSLPVRWK